MRVPDRLQNLDGAFARGVAALFGVELTSQLALQAAHVARRDELGAGANAEIQISGSYFCELDPEAFGFLLRVHKRPILAVRPRPAREAVATRRRSSRHARRPAIQ